MVKQFLSDKINFKTVSKPFTFPRYTRNVGAKRDFIHKYSLYIEYLYATHWTYTMQASKRAPQQAEETCFLNSEMPKKIHACPNVNKWIERHLRVPYYSPPLFPTIANHCSLHYDLTPQVGLLEKRRKLPFKRINTYSYRFVRLRRHVWFVYARSTKAKEFTRARSEMSVRSRIELEFGVDRTLNFLFISGEFNLTRRTQKHGSTKLAWNDPEMCWLGKITMSVLTNKIRLLGTGRIRLHRELEDTKPWDQLRWFLRN